MKDKIVLICKCCGKKFKKEVPSFCTFACYVKQLNKVLKGGGYAKAKNKRNR